MRNLEGKERKDETRTGSVYPLLFKTLLLTCDVTPYDRLEGYNLRFLDEDGATLKLLPVPMQLFRHLFDA
jgi:hypothetical protein